MDSSRLERFHAAQERAEGGFEAALRELRGTGKRGHWIWYVFPQVAGLGGSSMSREARSRGAMIRRPLTRPTRVAWRRAGTR